VHVISEAADPRDDGKGFLDEFGLSELDYTFSEELP
jgi:hypothetical protein